MTLIEEFCEYVSAMVLVETKNDDSDFVYTMMQSVDKQYSYHPKTVSLWTHLL